MKTEKKTENKVRSNCPVANTLDIIGDRWTLLIVRDLLKGKKRYKEFTESDEKIPTNILANRLKAMESEGIIVKVMYSKHPPRFEYVLTKRGKKLGEIVGFLRAWGNENLARNFQNKK